MYKIGKTKIYIHQINGFKKIPRLNKFKEGNLVADYKYNIIYQETLPMPQVDKCIYQQEQLIVEKNNTKFRYFHVWENCIYAVVDEIENDYKIYLKKEILDENIHPYFIPSLFHLENLLLKNESFVLHSSCVEINGQTILFTAPSGGGKSTQADLWMKYKDAKIINGDKNIVGKENNQWYSYGIPFSGSSEYCLNETHPIKAIIILEKGLDNDLIRVNNLGFSKIFSQVTVNPWDKDFCSKLMNLVIDACSEIPIYIYSCTKEKDAVDVLYNELFNGGDQ